MDGTTLSWNGESGEDKLEVFFVSAGTTNLNAIDDDVGPNQVFLMCDIACTVLSRKTFLANIHDPDNNETSLERVNIVGNQSDTQLFLYLNRA
eukprot:CAMPEP_0172545720 /NCGR_PEP_ID=MMETSP1067-20121228/15590_1 /TAXON_ID=265564 ORGANISM="Thalassiosira punctigera, Strain Tpunct2005C2" /NCGR_SAMPLE_ID=MMETSP1067 /ASSEMBLY_ACC=CAM_ASM_000444 /LENGTH=92 /DNA_ID=CAMNT_0013332515 /DNA_START=24 /DNA_END=298 /DNA_ORIENTATION=-